MVFFEKTTDSQINFRFQNSGLCGSFDVSFNEFEIADIEFFQEFTEEEIVAFESFVQDRFKTWSWSEGIKAKLKVK